MPSYVPFYYLLIIMSPLLLHLVNVYVLGCHVAFTVPLRLIHKPCAPRLTLSVQVVSSNPDTNQQWDANRQLVDMSNIAVSE